MFTNRLGVSPALLGAALYLSALFGGYLATFVLAGYVLLCESDEFLKKAAVKAVAVMLFFSLVPTVLYLLPDAINVINTFVSVFGGSFYVGFLSTLVNVCAVIVEFIRKVMFLWLAFKALKLSDASVPFVDKLIQKYMS